MNPACSASLLMNDTDVRFHLLHTYIHTRARDARGVFSINEDINTRTTSPELLGQSLHEHLTVSFE